MDPVVGLAYRDFRAYGGGGHSHIGLGVNAFHTVKVLRAQGIAAYPLCVWDLHDLDAALRERAFTHVVLEALWVTKSNLRTLAQQFPDVEFIVRSHSQVGFLQVEPGAVAILRDSLDLQESVLNVSVAGNSEKFQGFVQGVYNQDCLWLPNLYALERPAIRPRTPVTRKVRVASFGSIRHLKMHATAAAGAMLLAQGRGLDLEFHLSVHREEHGRGALQAIRNLFARVPWAKLVEDPWLDWGDFRRLVAHMDLFVQVSATETFNIATADALAEGVPSVVSTAIEWAPDGWQVDTDDADAIARVGWNLLSDSRASKEGSDALETYQEQAIAQWQSVLAE